MRVRVWVDADACPRVVRQIIERAVERGRASMVLVANRSLRASPSPHIRTIRVGSGFDAADRRIVKDSARGDVVITADVPLAAQLVRRGVLVLTPRGEQVTEDNAGERLAARDLLDELRSGGAITGGPAPLGPRDRQAFADGLDRLLTRLARGFRTS